MRYGVKSFVMAVTVHGGATLRKDLQPCSVAAMTNALATHTWLTKEEAADRLRVSPHTVDRYVRRGELTKHKLAGTQTVRFRADQVDALAVPVAD